MAAWMPARAERYCYEVQRIWGDGSTYCAFTSLLKYKDWYYVAFREGQGHVFDDDGVAQGSIRVIRSKDGAEWQSVAVFHQPELDYRDPKLSVTPQGRMMVQWGCSVYRDRKSVTGYPMVSFTDDGTTYDAPKRVRLDGCDGHRFNWPWRTTWHGDTGYTANYYEHGGQLAVMLMTTADGMSYTPLTGALPVPDDPTEATIRFAPDGRMALMVRTDHGAKTGYWALSAAPYTDWTFKALPWRCGGQDFAIQPDGRVICVARSLYLWDHESTSIYTGDLEEGPVAQRFILPSDGDTSYAGMLIEGGTLWVSYYSGHETEKPSIYLARLPLAAVLAAE